MKISRILAALFLVAFGAALAHADTIDTRFNVSDPTGTGNFPTTLTSNQFVTDGDGGFTINGIYTGAPIYSLKFVIPAADIIGPLSCTSNVFLVKVTQAVGGNPGVCDFETTTSLGIAWLFPPDLTGADDPHGYDCSLWDLDDCIGIQPGHFAQIGIPENMPAQPFSQFDVAANGSAPLPFPEPGSGISLLLGCVGLFLGSKKFSVR